MRHLMSQLLSSGMQWMSDSPRVWAASRIMSSTNLSSSLSRTSRLAEYASATRAAMSACGEITQSTEFPQGHT